MVRPVHFRVEGVGAPTPQTTSISQPTACYQPGFNVLDTDAVTCPLCRTIPMFILTALRHQEVVDMLSSPKEDHPCLTPNRPR
jgi:hypothetical protein